MVGTRLKYFRRIKEYSISELSEKTGISKSYLSYIERGIQKNPSLQIVSKLASALGITVDELMGSSLSNQQKEPELDTEWLALVEEAIRQGVSKEDFSYYLDYVRFQKQMKK